MNTISLSHFGKQKAMSEAKMKVKGKAPSTHDCYIIIGLSCILFGTNSRDNVGTNSDIILCRYSGSKYGPNL